MKPAAFLGVSLLSLVVAHLAATATKILQDIYWHELEDYARRHDRQRFDQIHDQADDVTIGTETVLYLSLATHVFFGIAWIVTVDIVGFRTLWDFSLGIAVGTAVLLANLVWLPNAVAEHAGTAFIYRTWPVWLLISRCLAPLAVGARAAEKLIRRLLAVSDEENEEEALEDEIRTIVTEGQHDGLLDSDTREMIEGVIELDDANVADIMTPREAMDVMSVNLDWDDILDFISRVGRTRIPVFEDGEKDFIGVLYVKDLFAELHKPAEARRPLREMLREAWNVSATMPLDELLQTFKQTRNHLALVSDEFNKVIGLVTIEDVLEEIVGEIVDESDKEMPGEIRLLAEHVAEVVGRAHIQEVNEALGCQLPEDDEFDTVGGFLMHQLGHIPNKGESVNWEDFELKVMKASGRRAEVVRITGAN